MTNIISKTYNEIELNKKNIWEWILISVLLIIILWFIVFKFSLSYSIAILSTIAITITSLKILLELRYRIIEEQEFLILLKKSKDYNDLQVYYSQEELLLKNIQVLFNFVSHPKMQNYFTKSYELSNADKELEELIFRIKEPRKKELKFDMYKYYFHENLTETISELNFFLIEPQNYLIEEKAFLKSQILIKNINYLQETIEYSSQRFDLTNDSNFRKIVMEFRELNIKLMEEIKYDNDYKSFRDTIYLMLVQIIKEIYILELKSKEIEKW